MSYSAGVFTINSTGQPVVTGTVISTGVFNAFTADIATGLSTCILKDGTQTVTAGVGLFAGTVSLPGIYLSTENTTGFYRISANRWGYSIAGTKLLDFSSAAVAITGTLAVSSTTTLSALLDISAAGAGQIKFPATQNASADANTLDDYEEGTWTMGINSTSPTYASRSGAYTKTGRSFTVEGFIALSNKGSVGISTITGLPFSLGVATGYCPLEVTFNNMTTSLIAVKGFIASGNTIQIYKITAATTSQVGTAVALTDLSNTTEMYLSFTSETA